MESKWQETTLGDIAVIKMGQSPKGDTCNTQGEGIALLNGPTEFGSNHPTPTQFSTDPKRFAKKGDLLFCVRGSTTGRMNWANQEYAIGRGLAALHHKGGIEYQPYLKAIIDYNLPKLLVTATGSTFPNVSKNQLHDLELNIPTLDEQKRIAHILGSLDDKIELNRQMNQTLEQMAQALFKSWFVDFDPVIDNAIIAGSPIPEELQARAEKRKALGKDRKALPKDIQKLFPDEFEFSEELEKWVPRGWRVNSINKLVRSVSETYPLKSVDKVIFLNTGDILEGKFLHEEYSNTIGLPGQAKKSIQKGDILYSEIRPKNKRYAYVFFDSSEYVVSTKLMVLRSITDINSLFVYYFLKQEENVNQMQLLAESRSGTFPQITFDILSSLKIALPNNNDIVDYYTDNYLIPYYSKMLQLEKDNQNLTKLRDTLLPKLISGEVRVPEVEKMIE